MSGDPGPVPSPNTGPSGAPAPAPVSPSAAPVVGPVPALPAPELGARRRRRLLAVAAISVVALVLVATFALGLLGGPPHAAPAALLGTSVSFASAFGPARAEALVATGAPWTLVAAEGIGLSAGLSGQNPSSVFGGGCSAHPAPGSPAVFTIWGTPSNATSGEVALWLFFAINASGSSVLLLAENATAAVPLEIATGSSCLSVFGSLTPLNASAVIDSTAAARQFDAQGGAAWAGNHSVQTRMFILEGTPSLGGAFDWVVTYSTCDIAAVSGSGVQLMGAVDGSTGAPVGSPSQSTVAC